MGNIWVEIIASTFGIIGVILGIFISQHFQNKKKDELRQKYAKIIYYELCAVKNELDIRFSDFETQKKNVEKKYCIDNLSNLSLDCSEDPYNFLLRWSYWPKYEFLRQNFEKLSFFEKDTIISIINLYSPLEEFEHYKQIAISKNLEYNNIGTSAKKIACDCFIKAHDEIPHALSQLKKELHIPDEPI